MIEQFPKNLLHLIIWTFYAWNYNNVTSEKENNYISTFDGKDWNRLTFPHGYYTVIISLLIYTRGTGSLHYSFTIM